MLDRSRTPTRMTPVDSTKGRPWYCEPTRMTVQTGASVLVEDNAALELDNNSTLHLMPGSRLVMARKAKLTVRNGCRIIQHSDAVLEGRAKHFRKARRSGRIVHAQ